MYSFVDIETTGSHSHHHHITEIAIMNWDGDMITDSFITLVKPDSGVPLFITHLTGITNGMVERAPLFEDIADRIEIITKDRILVAHNAHFDYSFLKQAFKNNGKSFQRRILCTLRLSRKILPGFKSYALDSLCRSLQISQRPEHRAGADALATLEIFRYLQNTDKEDVIQAALKKTSEFNFPPYLPVDMMKGLPNAAGVYYFKDEHGKILYIGKAKNLKQRINNHFVTSSTTRTRTKLMNHIHSLHYELCGNELVAMLMESAEIKKHFPPFNVAQKISDTNYGIYCYEDGNGYLRLGIKKLKVSDRPLVIFPFLSDARSFLIEKCKQFCLCPKLCGLQRSQQACFDFVKGDCEGACCGKVSVQTYNKNVEGALAEFSMEAKSYAVIGKGRTEGESTIVVIEKGRYLGFGFTMKIIAEGNYSEMQETIRHSRDNREVQRIIQSYLNKNQDYKLVSYKV